MYILLLYYMCIYICIHIHLTKYECTQRAACACIHVCSHTYACLFVLAFREKKNPVYFWRMLLFIFDACWCTRNFLFLLLYFFFPPIQQHAAVRVIPLALRECYICEMLCLCAAGACDMCAWFLSQCERKQMLYLCAAGACDVWVVHFFGGLFFLLFASACFCTRGSVCCYTSLRSCPCMLSRGSKSGLCL